MLCWLPSYQSAVLILRVDGEISDTKKGVNSPISASLRGQNNGWKFVIWFIFFLSLPPWLTRPTSSSSLPSSPPSLLQWFPLELCSESLTPHAPCVWFLLVIWRRPLRAFCLGTGAVKAEISLLQHSPHPSVCLSQFVSHTYAHTVYIMYNSTAATRCPTTATGWQEKPGTSESPSKCVCIGFHW